MIRPRVFIASSSGARDLVTELEAALKKENGELEIEPWFQPLDPAASSHLLSRLVQWSRRCDFAVVILTRDNQQKGLDSRQQIEVPRDNCVFELGLFVGAFGGSQRCILLSEIDHGVLVDQLSDIGGLLYEHFDLAKMRGDNGAAWSSDGRKKIAAMARKIAGNIAAQGRFVQRPRFSALRIEDVLERENDPAVVARHDVVVVKEQQPAELKLAFARAVMSNIMDRHVRYHYLFGRTRGKYEAKIVEMLRSLIASALLDESEYAAFDAGNNDCRRDVLERCWQDRRKQVIKAIASLKRDLLIGLVDDIEFDEFCVHRANVKRRRQGYLKLNSRRSSTGEVLERYVPMESIDTSMRLQHRGYGALERRRKEWNEDWIFKGAQSLTVRPAERDRIELAIKLQFPTSYQRRLVTACFGSGKKHTTAAATRRRGGRG